MRFVIQLLLTGIICVAAVFAVANRAVTKIALHPLPFTAELPLYVIILGALAIGLVIGVGLSSISRFRLKLESKKYQKRAEPLKIVKKKTSSNAMLVKKIKRLSLDKD
jgi:putative membrane protein